MKNEELRMKKERKKLMKKLLISVFCLLSSVFCFAADVHWTGAATAVAQVDTFTPANVEVGDIFTLTVTGYDGTGTTVSFTATAATAANVVAGIETAWNASTHALCTPITADSNSIDGVATLTADTAGNAFSVASTATNGGAADTQTFSRAATTASAGPKHWDCTANWDTGALPGGAASQNVYIEDASAEILYGLNQSGIANTLTSLNIEKTFTGKIGYNGATGKTGTYLQIKATAVNIGYNYSGASASGSGRLMIDTGSTASTVTVYEMGSASDTGKPACRLKANSASTDIIVHQGKVGIAYEAGETSTIDDLTIGYTASASGQVEVTVGNGLTVDDIAKRIGTLTLRSACDVLTNESGACYLYGSGTVGTLTINSGTVYSSTTGTITTASADGGTLDLTGSLSARTITTAKIGNGGSIKYDPSIIAITNGITLVETAGKFLITSQEF
jgi:hypothetical protein